MNPYSSDPETSYSTPAAELVSNEDGMQLNPNGNSINAGRATAWFGLGFDQFKASPGVWIGMLVVLMILMFLMAMVPVLGSLASNILMPVFFGGLMLACHTQKQGGEVRFEHLFAGFKENFGNLALLGLFWLIGVVLVTVFLIVVMMVMVGGALATGALSGGLSAGLMGMGIGTLVLMVLIGFILFIPVSMAIWFAPSLVMLNKVAPFDALMMSLRGALKNWGAFLLFLLLYILLAIVATIPIFLGWLILGPVLVGAMYAAYRDIFLQAKTAN